VPVSPTTDLDAVKHAMDRLLAEDPAPLCALVAADAEFGVITPEAEFGGLARGRRHVADYFEALGGIVTFWRVRCLAAGDQVLAVGRESFTTTGGLEGGSEFVLVFEMSDRLITRLLVVEDAGDALHTLGGQDADDHDGGRHRDLLQGLGHGAAGGVQPRLAVDRRRLGRPDDLPGRPGIPLHRA
jgi:ketosteroid isomerase-like protein